MKESPLEKALPGKVSTAVDGMLDDNLPQSVTAAESAAKFAYPHEHSMQVDPSPPSRGLAPSIDPPSHSSPRTDAGAQQFTGMTRPALE
jgi:hypothetical protein